MSKARRKDHISYKPSTGFTGITDADKEKWQSLYPDKHIESEIRLAYQRTLILYSDRLKKKIEAKPRSFIEWHLSQIEDPPESEPEPDPTTFAELAKRIKCCRTFTDKIFDGEFDMEQAKKDYAKYYWFAYILGGKDIPPKTDNAAYDLIRLCQWCQNPEEKEKTENGLTKTDKDKVQQAANKKRGRPKEHTIDKAKEVYKSYLEYEKEGLGKKYAWDKAAKKHKMESGDAAKMMCRRELN